MRKILVVAPHPDDETLGCGGTLLKHKKAGDKLFWLIVSGITEKQCYTKEQISKRDVQIKKVAAAYGFKKTIQLGFPTRRLDALPLSDLIEKIGESINAIGPEILYLPFPGDAHSDHLAVFNAVSPCTKWFRYGATEKVLCYETLSETDFSISPICAPFRPNVFVDVSEFIDEKIKIMETYAGELGEFPFPRSKEAISALARYRGTSSGFNAAEAFMLLRDRMSGKKLP